MNKNTKVASIILAGGRGSRLLPLTQTKSKPAVPVGGRYWLVDVPISESLRAQFSQIFIITQRFSQQIKTHVRNHYSHTNQQKIHFLPSSEQDALTFQGTADAVRKNLSIFLQSDAEFFCILSGDQIYSINFSNMVQIAEKHNAPLVIGATPVALHNATRMGLLQTDTSQRITKFIEKPQKKSELQQMVHFPHSSKPYLASMGIYLFHRQFLENLLQGEGNDFGFDLLPQAIQETNVHAYIHQGYWEDIGTISSYHHANILIAQENAFSFTGHSCALHQVQQQTPSFIDSQTHLNHVVLGEGVQIRAQSICNSVIGSHCVVEQDSVIENSIMLTPYNPADFPVVGKNSQLKKVILDEGASIGNNVRLQNQRSHKHFDGEKILVRDGIIIVPKGSHIPHNFSF